MTISAIAIMVLVPLAFIGLAIAARATSGGTAMLSRCLTTLAGLPVLGFFLFGFLASFEGSGANFWAFRVAYVLLFLAVSATVVFVWLPHSKVDPDLGSGDRNGDNG